MVSLLWSSLGPAEDHTEAQSQVEPGSYSSTLSWISWPGLYRYLATSKRTSLEQGWMQAAWPHPAPKSVHQFSKALLSLLWIQMQHQHQLRPSLCLCTSIQLVATASRTAVFHALTHSALVLNHWWTGVLSPTYRPLPAPHLNLLLPGVNVEAWPG